jgi:hydrogenase expression/formation protein HypC
MCLAVPGRILQIDEGSSNMSTGLVGFGGINKEICLAYVPEARVGDYVLVHVGFAIQTIDEEEARGVFRILNEMSDLSELDP